jgi:hypothetical protein
MFELFLRARQVRVHTLEVAQGTDILVLMRSLSRTLAQNSNEILPRQVQLSSHATVHHVAVAAGECHTCIFRSFSTAFFRSPSRRSRRLFLTGSIPDVRNPQRVISTGFEELRIILRHG